MGKKNINLLVFAFIIPVIGYILFPGRIVLAQLIQFVVIAWVLKRNYYRISFSTYNANHIIIFFLGIIFLSIIHSLLVQPLNYSSIRDIIIAYFSSLMFFYIYTVCNLYDLGFYFRAFFIFIIPCAFFSSLYWDGFLTFDVPHILIPFSFFLLISSFFPLKYRLLLFILVIFSVLYHVS